MDLELLMLGVEDYYDTLLQAQTGYLLAMHEFASKNSLACAVLFNMKASQVSSLQNVSKKDWYEFISNLKNWVLSTKLDVANHCLFEYFINNSHSMESISQLVNSRVLLGTNLVSEQYGLSNISKYQSVIFQNICLCAQSEPSFTKGLLFLPKTTIDLIREKYLRSNKLHFIDPIFPVFTINKNIHYGTLFKIDKTAHEHVEQALFSFFD